MRTRPFDAIVLAGGSSRRLGGRDKATVTVGGRTLLQRALDAVAGAEHRIVSGPDRGAGAGVRQVQEQPPGGGPVAGVAAALPHVTAETVVVVACDLPFVSADVVARLVGDLDQGPPVDAVRLVDPDGRVQYLTAAYRTDRLRAAVAALERVEGAAVRHLVEGLTSRDLPADAETTLDCDTWDDVARSRSLLEDSS